VDGYALGLRGTGRAGKFFPTVFCFGELPVSSNRIAVPVDANFFIGRARGSPPSFQAAPLHTIDTQQRLRGSNGTAGRVLSFHLAL